MHLSDAGIQTLEQAMAQARAQTKTRKTGDTAALKALRDILKGVVVRPDDLPFGTVQPERALPGHLLLADAWVTSAHGDKLWARLSGTGRHYNGMFGTPEELQAGHGALTDKDVIAGLLHTEEAYRELEPYDIGTRVAIALRILAAPSVARVMPQAARAVQRMLSEELLAHPVLLHPAILVPGAGGKEGSYVALGKAIAATGCAGLPRRSDFQGETPPGGAGGPFGTLEALYDAKLDVAGSVVASRVPLECLYDAKRPEGGQGSLFGDEKRAEPVAARDVPDEFEQRLLDFALHPCVRLGLSQASVEVTDKTLYGNSSGGIRFRRSRFVTSTMKLATSQPAFIGSVMELETLVVRHQAEQAGGAPAKVPFPLPFPFTVLGGLKLDAAAITSGANYKSPDVEDSDVDESHLVALTVLASLYTSFGTLNLSSSVAGKRPMSERVNPADPAFVLEVRRRLEVLRAQSSFAMNLGPVLKRRVFMGRFDELSPEDLEFNARRVLDGFVAAGLAPDARAAAAYMLEHALGRSRSDMALPKTSVEAAVAFVKVLVSTGVLGKVMGPGQTDLEGSFEQLMEKAMVDVVDFPGYEVPFRSVWLKAMELVSVEARMRAVIDAVSEVPEAAVATVECVTKPVEEAAPRRRRAAV
ncbi:hypothetical protein [Methylibium petroleiphilum]|uniref:Uncharacterized protein n=1 Tax=Methylibium petroleiphilum (strain ATCC BAA-1232 / LMG 22953 / PM1) TaxID=420662 RepID=A2SML2_METPP|nr:hypothetical protein [Methylibium petroleiphilum]ABM96801.1 hypothetical protein Mpe_B0020 [Methylibium petroleiphilum PM1]